MKVALQLFALVLLIVLGASFWLPSDQQIRVILGLLVFGFIGRGLAVIEKEQRETQ